MTEYDESKHFKVGNKYYSVEDVQKIFNDRIEELDGIEEPA